MNLVADVFLAAGALGAAFYCFILARRLKRFNDLEQGVGGAVAALSGQVDDLVATMQSAQSMSGQSTDALATLTGQAESVAKRLELMMAALHDVPQDPQPKPEAAPVFTRHRDAEKAGEE